LNSLMPNNSTNIIQIKATMFINATAIITPIGV